MDEISENSHPFTEWRLKLSQLLDGSKQKKRLFPTKLSPRRTREAKDDETKTKWYRFATQQIRRDLTRGLGDLYEDALKFSQDETLSNARREKWGRLAGSLAKTINTVTRTYDELQVEKAIRELKEYVETHLDAG